MVWVFTAVFVFGAGQPPIENRLEFPTQQACESARVVMQAMRPTPCTKEKAAPRPAKG